MVLVDDAEVRDWSQLVNPQMRIQLFFEQMTGISNQMVDNAPRFEQVAKDVVALISSLPCYVPSNCREHCIHSTTGIISIA